MNTCGHPGLGWTILQTLHLSPNLPQLLLKNSGLTPFLPSKTGGKLTQTLKGSL